MIEVPVLSIQESLHPELTCFGFGHSNPDGFHLRSYRDDQVTVATFTPRAERQWIRFPKWRNHLDSARLSHRRSCDASIPTATATQATVGTYADAVWVNRAEGLR